MAMRKEVFDEKMLTKHPTTIFRYRPGLEREIKTIIDSQLWCQRADLLNDPYDSFPPCDNGVSLQYMSYVSCFAEKYNSMYFWSHYAAQHTGICIEYDFEMDLNIFPVIYTAKPIDFPYILPGFIKSMDWKMEKEWRYMSLNEDRVKEHSTGFIDNFIEPKAVYFGLRVDQKTMESNISEISCAHKKCKFYKILNDEKKYRLFRKEI